MTLFRINWLRRLIRNNTNPIAQDRASQWKQRLSILYAILAWNAFGFVGYMMYQGKADWAKYYGLKNEEEEKISPGHQWANVLGIKKAQVFRVNGLTIHKMEEEQEVVKN